MILNYENVGDSAYNGATLSQKHLAGPDHMQTDINQATPWSTGLFRIGVNRWRQGTSSGYYVDLASPSDSDFRTALQSDIGNSTPFGVSTLETDNGPHYNHHPQDETIGHWIVGQGYLDSLDTTSFDDPAAHSSALSSAWDQVNNDFTSTTNSFNQTFVQPHGITW